MDFDTFTKKMNDAYKNSNFFDSQNAVDDLKAKYGEKETKKFIRQALEVRKTNQRNLNAATRRLEQKYQPRDVYKWEDALNYVTHKYQRGEHIFFYYNGIHSGEIKKLTTKGYVVSIGRKLSIQPTIPFSHVICHVSNTKRILEEIRLLDAEEKNVSKKA